MRVVRKRLERSAPRQGRIGLRHAETYAAEQFFADVGIMLIVFLGLALVVHLVFMMFGS